MNLTSLILYGLQLEDEFAVWVLLIPFWPFLSLVQLAQNVSVGAISTMGEALGCQSWV